MHMAGCNPIRVMIVDDHTMVRRGLATVLKTEPDLELAGEASDGMEAISLCEQAQPDVVLMDMVMPRMDGMQATQAILERWPRIRVIALTSFHEKELVQGALDAGAIGYLLKNISTEELVQAIRAAHAGRQTMAPEALEILELAGKLEALSHALTTAPPDGSALTGLLAEHVPAILPDCCIEVRIFPKQTLFHHPSEQSAAPPAAWTWLESASAPAVIDPGAPLPWGAAQPPGVALLMAPIVDPDDGQALGGICASTRRAAPASAELLPGLQALAVQIGSALRSVRMYDQAQTRQRVSRELALAAQIQAGFLPEAAPLVPGWQLSAALEPARETSGDFYDFISLPGERLGILVADVADKGMAAALYMALCRTLIRTFAMEFGTQPALVFAASNRRMLQDARSTWFVTALYGVLDPESGALTYCSAGHHPAYLLGTRHAKQTTSLAATGMALGVSEVASWEERTIHLAPGDALVIYTDGITEAQDPSGQFFGERRLLEAVPAGSNRTAQSILDGVLAATYRFVGTAPQFDDITLVVLTRSTRETQHEPDVRDRTEKDGC
jgi:serine phosphatase RsbU (regulator of sigma subunit)/DNA-binding NarL/FixJ family response regulator